MIGNILVYFTASETIHVHVCMFKKQLNITIFRIIQLINMNIGLSEYPVEDWVTASPDFPLSPIVSDLNRCSRIQSMQADDRSADSL
jgi:hypothetical protein